ncbi:unnamed protein product [Candidula unifasciata]|uniref:Uncharacterized protein n=1 Tax=Candidula unifasciata TaxID=100452 RepID=A0A8S4A486_9EUPU|nr:unnamed protein product [Candidula unifasciata]
MHRPDTFGVLSICLLLICMTCQLEQQPGSHVTPTHEGNNTCVQGYFGRACVSKCPSPCSQTCDSHGYCTACSRTGVQLPNCTLQCPNGFYGLHCQNRCSECRNSACNPHSGECRKCRFPGLRLPFCTNPCLPGTFGMDCKNRCPLPCRQKCDMITGDCFECEYGQGPRCQVNCASEDNMEACKRYCLGRCLTWCNSSSGMCSICVPGYKAPVCKNPCDDGRFGHNCAERCSVRCRGGRCDPTTGVCYACSDGYVGQRCNGQCIPGFFGAGCTSSCPPTCADGLCNFTSGDCTRCNPGYTGPGCDQFCGEGKFGEGCQQDCPIACGGKCDPVSGECWRCLPGYVGIFCNESCKQGTYGPGCASLCPAGCLQRMCNHVTGACIACQDYLQGKLCDQSKVPSSTPVHVLIIISLSMTLVVLTLLVSVICFRRKMRRSQTETTNSEEKTQTKEEAAGIGNMSGKLQTEAVNPHESPAATSASRARDSRGRLTTRPAALFIPLTQQVHNPTIKNPVHLCLRPGLRSSKVPTPREFDSKSSQNLDNQFAHLLKQQLQGIAARPYPSRTVGPRRLGKNPGQMSWYTGKSLLNKESITDLPKFGKLSDRRREHYGFSPEGRTSSMREEGSITTPGRNEFRSDGKTGRETKITLFEHTECVSGKTTVSTAWSVNLPPYTPLVPSRQTPEQVIAQSRDSFLTGRIVSSADSLFGLASADLSREMSNMSQRKSQVLEREQTTQPKGAPPCRQVATNRIRSSASHVFSDKKTAITQKSTVLRRQPSVYSLPETILSTHLTCVTHPVDVHSDIRSMVHSDGRLAWTKPDLKSCMRNLTTKHEISISDQPGSDVGQPSSLSEAARISCVSERSAVVSDSSKSARRTSHGDKPRPSDPQTGYTGLFYSCLNKVETRGHREHGAVPGDETIPHSETNSWLNYEDQDDTATCCDVSSHIKVHDSRPTFGEVVVPETLPVARSTVGSSSYHRVANMNPNVTPPKQLGKAQASQDEDTQDDTSDGLFFQHRSEKLTTMPFTDREAAEDKAVQARDDLFVHLAPAKLGVGSKRTNRSGLPGDNASPKLMRCSTTRQVSPMYSYNTSQMVNRLQPLPTPPPEGIKALRPVRKRSMSSSSSESQVLDTDTTNEKHHS